MSLHRLPWHRIVCRLTHLQLVADGVFRELVIFQKSGLLKN
jgi:hypothetical protein